MNKNNPLLNIDGQKIRRQYFNGILWFATVCVVPYALITYLMNLFFGRETGALCQFSEVIGVFIVLLIMMIPVIILSILNRSFFGDVVCVLEKEGLHHKDGFIIWDAIVKMEYELNIPTKDRKYFCYVSITKHSRFGAEIIHAPYFLLKEAKNYHISLEVGMSKRSKFLIRFFMIVLVFFIVLYNLLPSLIQL